MDAVAAHKATSTDREGDLGGLECVVDRSGEATWPPWCPSVGVCLQIRVTEFGL